MTAPVIPGAEPFSATGGAAGVLVLHGFTGNPFSMRAVAHRLADEGLTVELPLLPGHGTSLDDLTPTRWADWTAAADGAYQELSGRCDSTAVVGLSMGGALACWLGEQYPEIAGLALVNPIVKPPDDELRRAAHELLESGVEIAPSIGSDIADPDARELSYDGTPLAPALSLFEGLEDLALSLDRIVSPVLLLSSRQDHVVDPSNGDLLVETVSGSVERVWLERSYHVATLDFDKEEVQERICAFVARVTTVVGVDAT